MPPIRFRSRSLHATLYDYTQAGLTAKGWVTPPVNFGTSPVTFTDYQPDERNTKIADNTVAVSLGDYASDEDEELGAAVGGLRSAPYRVFFDVYMAKLSLSLALCDDLRDLYTDRTIPLIDQITGQPMPGVSVEIEEVFGPERPSQVGSTDPFRRFWRIMSIQARVYFLTS